MDMNLRHLVIAAACVALPVQLSAKSWTLKACIDYAMLNNITLQKNRLTKVSATEDIKESQAALLPSLSFSTSQNVSYNPWPQSNSSIVAGNRVQSSVDKAYYNGSYSLSTNWTVWNGNRNHNQVKLNKYAEQQADLTVATYANSLTEQISQLFVQILYSDEAIKVNRESLATSTKNEERGKEMFNVGKMSKADLAQLTAQRAQDEYAVVQAESALSDYKRQLKQLLQITDQEAFDVVVPETTDAMALQTIPQVTEVYEAALSNRPEIKNAMLGIKYSDMQAKLARAGKMPTVSISGSVGTNTTSMGNTAWGTQLKNNLVGGAGVSLSIPLLDQRQTKTAVNKAVLSRQNYELELEDRQTALYSAIENYWLQATNNQAQFKSAKVSTASAETSYNLLNEQFRQNLKNVIELMNGKDALLKAQQAELQAKYLAILNINMLKFYEGSELK